MAEDFLKRRGLIYSPKRYEKLSVRGGRGTQSKVKLPQISNLEKFDSTVHFTKASFANSKSQGALNTFVGDQPRKLGLFSKAKMII